MIPEIGTEVAFCIFIAEVGKQTTRILNGAPLKNAVDRNVEHNRIHIFKNVGIKYARLTHNNPILNTALNEYTLCYALRNSIMVIYRYLERIAATSPMDRIVTTACFGNGAYVADLNCVRIRLSKNCLADILSSTYICFLCSVRFPVSCRRNHAAYMKNIVRTCYCVENILIVCKIAPNYSD